MLQAPASINAVMWGLLRRDSTVVSSTAPWLSSALDGISHALFWYSVLLVCLTLVATWQRRAAIRSQGFHWGWVALTFPSCSTSIAALHYSRFDGGSAGPGHLPAWSQSPLLTYALVVSALTCVTVVAVAVGVARQELQRAQTVGRAVIGCDAPSKEQQTVVLFDKPQQPPAHDGGSNAGWKEECDPEQPPAHDGGSSAGWKEECDPEQPPAHDGGSSAGWKEECDPERPPYPLTGSGSLVFDEPDSPLVSTQVEDLLRSENEGP